MSSETVIPIVTEHQPPPPPVYVFVFAHPDDESMFFLPTIRSLVDAGETVWFLCLTTGNYDGLGKLREKEMERAGKLVGASRVIVRNDCERQHQTIDISSNSEHGRRAILDHPTKRYDKTIVTRAIRESLSHQQNNGSNKSPRFVLITFDAKGVSGHVNHTDVYLGVVHLMEEEEQTQKRKQKQKKFESLTIYKCEHDTQPKTMNPVFLEAWYLESEPSVLRKYVPVLSWLLLLLSCFASKATSTSTSNLSKDNDKADVSGTTNNSNTASASTTTIRYTRIYRMHDPSLNWAAMATHQSQFVWYRRLFVVFSCYTYYNKMLCRKRKEPTR